MSRLKADLDSAWRDNVAARARFDNIMRETPQGLPHPDGSLRIRQAGVAMNMSLQNYIQALRRFTDFVTCHSEKDETGSVSHRQ
jgi:hypothetical protein